MKVVVAGAGKIGRYLSADLVVRGHEVTMIELSKEALDRAPTEGVRTVLGDACAPKVLERAGVREADVVVAATGDDEDNLVVCQTARQKFHVARTIARVNNPKNEQLFRMLGVDVTVSQTNYILNLIEQSIPDRPFLHLLSLRYADLAIVEARVSETSPVAHSPIGEIDLPVDCVIAAVSRGNHVMVPAATTELEPGDDVIAVTRPEQEDELRRLLCEDC